MITNTTVKTRLGITDTDSDTLIDELITDAYNYIGGLIGVTIGSDDTITETFNRYYTTSLDFSTTLPIDSVISLKDSDGTEIKSYFFYTAYLLREKYTSSYNVSTDDIERYTLIYTTTATNTIDTIALDYVLYTLEELPEYRGTLYMKSKNNGSGLVEAFVTSDDFFRSLNARISNLSIIGLA